MWVDLEKLKPKIILNAHKKWFSKVWLRLVRDSYQVNMLKELTKYSWS